MLLTYIIPLIVLVVMAGLGGVGGGVIDASTNGLISGIYSERRGMALNLFNLLYPLGGVIVALTDAGLLKAFHNDPRPCFLFTMCFTVGAMISLLLVPKRYEIVGDNAPRHMYERDANKEGILSLAKILVPVILVMMFTSGVSSSL